MGLVEGRDISKELGITEYKTGPGTPSVSLVRRMTKPLRGTGKIVIMHSGFCVLRGLFGMFNIVVCGSTLVKKRSY